MRDGCLAILLLGLQGCSAPAELPDGFEVETDISCDQPASSWEGKLQEAHPPPWAPLEFGLREPAQCPAVPGGVVAHDLDGDRDVDLLFRGDDAPVLLRNSGDSLDQVPGPTQPPFGPALAYAAADLDGDGLSELLAVGQGFVAVASNLGEMSFADWAPILVQDEYPQTCFQTLAIGDANGDGLLDLVLPGLESLPDEAAVSAVSTPLPGSPVRLLHGDGAGNFSAPIALPGSAGEERLLSMLAVFTDRDGDGDQDLLVGSDRADFGYPASRFYRNDGGAFSDDAQTVGAALRISAMGLATADLNGDGVLDYCMSDVGSTLPCLVSRDGVWLRGGLSLGLELTVPDGIELDPYDWSTWSLDLEDLDNDGNPELAAAAGPPPDEGSVLFTQLPFDQPDALFEGTEEGFRDLSAQVGFDDPRPHYGLATADFFGDGAPDIVLGAWNGPPVFWENQCNDRAWVEVELVGPPGNREGFGARVEAGTGERRWTREVQALRAVGQGPSSVHLGLDDADVVHLRVTWPDGTQQLARDLPVRSRILVTHPDA